MENSKKRIRKSRAKPFQDPKTYDMKIDSKDIAWLAGILEGEGSFGIDKRACKKYEDSVSPAAPFIKLSMTDRDVVTKFGKLVQKKPFQASKLTAGGKVEYIVHVGNRQTLFYLLPQILPYMGIRRAARVQECIDLLEMWRDWMMAGGRNQSAAKGGKATAMKKKKENN